MDSVLTVPGAAVTLGTMERTANPRRSGERGQTAVEYILTTMALVTAFASMYAFIQGQEKILFRRAAIVILRSYY